MITTLEEALRLYGIRPADTRESLVAAGKEAARWRQNGPRATALVLVALYDNHNLSFRQIEAETGIDHVTCERLIRRLREGKV